MSGRGRYIYGVAAGTRSLVLGPLGIESSEVYTISGEGFRAVVHRCPVRAYESADKETVTGWAESHQRVLDEAKRQLGSVIPMTFDTILRPRDEVTEPDEVVKGWLRDDHLRLQLIMERIKERDEYGVQVFYEPGVIGDRVAARSTEIQRLRQEMAGKPPGLAYLYEKKLEKAVRAEMESFADEQFRLWYGRIKPHCDDIAVERTRKADRNRAMLLNLSCLVAGDKVDSLGEELERINRTEGFSVRFSGPWPPYSFVLGASSLPGGS